MTDRLGDRLLLVDLYPPKFPYGMYEELRADMGDLRFIVRNGFNSLNNSLHRGLEASLTGRQ